MTYRPDVDGLRAIAIIFVLIFHAGLPLFPSGFIGVDIFFVISGFLITGIIHHSLKTNQFSLVHFYHRRLWRMQPVFICLLLLTAAITLVFYLPDDLMLFGRSVRKTSIFTSNYFFQRITNGYFSPEVNQLPLLHTWSLSIEWQCYLILPVLIFALYKLFGPKKIQPIVLTLTGLAFALSLYYSVNAPDKTYYQLSSRLFEFLIGSHIALSPQRYTWNKHLLNACTLLAGFSLIYIGLSKNIQQGYPNWYALWIGVSTAVLIHAGTQDSKPWISQVLSFKPLVWIGLISYSLYIWHWPIFVLLQYLELGKSFGLICIAFAVTFLVAYLSWRFIEKPTRKLHSLPLMYSLILLLIFPILGAHLGANVIQKHEGYPQRFAETSQVYAVLKQYESPRRALCLQQKNTHIDPSCLLGAGEKANKTALLIGDSFANQHWQFMDILAKNAGISVLSHATPACLALPGIVQFEWYQKNEAYQECVVQTNRYYDLVKTNHFDFVILGQNWSGYLGDKIIQQIGDARSYRLSQQRIEEALRNALETITASGATPVIIKSIALSPGKNPHNCFLAHIKRRKAYHPELCDFPNYPEAEKWFNRLFAKMQQQFPQLIFIDPKKVQCPEGLCKADIKGIPVFRDAVHINDYAAHEFAIMYLKKQANPLLTGEGRSFSEDKPMANMNRSFS